MKRSPWSGFLNLAPAIRVGIVVLVPALVALTGWFVLPALLKPQAQWALLAVSGAGALLAAGIWGVGVLRRTRGLARLSDALRSQGPTRADEFEQTEVIREKFTRKLGDLKANGLSVYRLPWFILLGEPGCGKTYTLIHSGLDFPLGKDEVPGFGGTRNYNWWFTEDAVILDTAGRIAFHEEGTTDKTEWEYFLKLLRQNRSRCPINGVIVAVPADKLLRDNSDERSQKAIILRDRLRQLQRQLGVRFPAFLLVTKMDLVGGFNEFCEEIRVDLAAKNQMFGWSRPGEFQEPYDPDTFPEVFDGLRRRIRDWSLRYLQRNVPADERELIATFPESFHGLAAPLGEYIATLFKRSPLIEPPFLRGFYFTSSVQEGVPILDALRRSRAGAGLVESPPKPVESKPFFIHDTYARKVFPEAGLVFRSSRDVLRNRRARRLVWLGSIALLAMMAGLFAFGAYGVRGLVTAPQQDCRQARLRIEDPDPKLGLAERLDLARRLEGHIRAYDRPDAALLARFVSVGADIGEPRRYVEQVHARYVLSVVARPLVLDLEQRLAAVDRPTSPGVRQDDMAALTVYAQWCADVLSGPDPPLDETAAAARAAAFNSALGALALGEAERQDVARHTELALASLARQSCSFRKHVLIGALGFDEPRAVAGVAIVARRAGAVAESWKRAAELSDGSPDAAIRYWVGLAARVRGLRQRYDELLSLAPRLSAGGEQAAEARRRLVALTAEADNLGNLNVTPSDGSIAREYDDLAGFLGAERPPTVDQRIVRPLPVADAASPSILSLLARQWEGEFAAIEGALRLGAERTNNDSIRQALAEVQEARKALSDDVRRRLEELVATALGDGALSRDPLEWLAAGGLVRVVEGGSDQTPSVALAPDALGPADRVRRFLVELDALARREADLPDRLPPLTEWPALVERISAAGGAEPAADGALGPWLAAGRADPGQIASRSGLSETSFWQPARLYRLADAVWNQQVLGRRDALLKSMAAAAASTANAEAAPFSKPGAARLMGDAWQDDDGLPFMANRFNTGQDAAHRPLLTRYHTRESLIQTLQAVAAVQDKLDDAGLRAALDSAADAYVAAYFADWRAVCASPPRLHDESVLRLLEECSRGGPAWSEFTRRLTDVDIDAAVGGRAAAIRRHMLEVDAEVARDGGAEVRSRLASELREARQSGELERRLTAAETPAARNAWREYVAGLRALDDPGSVGGLPDAAALINAAGASADSNGAAGLWAPLAALAQHAPGLAQHELLRRTHERVAPLAGQYPIGDPPGGERPGDLAALAGVRTIDPQQFLDLLRDVARFQGRYGNPDLSTSPEPTAATVERCAAWARFVYGDSRAPLTSQSAKPLPVRLWVTEQSGLDGVRNFTNFYGTLSIRLPLLDAAGQQPAGPIELSRSAVLRTRPADFNPQQRQADGRLLAWALSASGLQPVGVTIRDLNPGTIATRQSPATPELPASAWSFLLLLEHANRLPGGAYAVPVTLDAGGVRVGLALLLEVGDAARKYPGQVPTPVEPGPPPKLDARRFLDARP